ncbi:hypothetical protein AXF42_Ash012342 [Apostasia shenzhenica]|uniref:PORR domain-containing protein n=1 Tax=Apostasia shenzhenica TaxID=1088818 RepID=A0A2I0ACX9_9ASPA|nr:hypothetical protein AXF42_Ash012342 [Apostasia shenzhenica]
MMTILHRTSWHYRNIISSVCPFNCFVQKRWKKPVDSAQTRLENRTIDLQLDKLVKQIKKLNLFLRLHELMSKRRASHTSVQLLSKWRNTIGLNVRIGSFIQRHSQVFELYMHPVKRNLCCRISAKMLDLIAEEDQVIRESEMDIVQRLKKLLLMSNRNMLNAHALWLARREFGLPDDFRDSILQKYPNVFRLVDPDTLELITKDDILAIAEVEKWRKREYVEKWLSEFEIRYAFPIHFPTGFKIESGLREKIKNWQRLPYPKPYCSKDAISVGRSRSSDRSEKHAVGILHEFLSLTVEKLIDAEKIAHFRRDLNIEVNLRELFLKHPGIFYLSTKGNTLTVIVREKYVKGHLNEPNRIYMARRKMLDFLLSRHPNPNRKQHMEEH